MKLIAAKMSDYSPVGERSTRISCTVLLQVLELGMVREAKAIVCAATARHH